MLHLTPDISHLKCTYVTCDMWHMVGGESSLKISAPQLLRFGIDSVLMMLNKRMTQLISELIHYKGIYKTAPETRGPVIRLWVFG